MDQELKTYLDLIQTGARQTVRFVEWSEKVDVTLAEFRERIQAIESRG